MRDNTEETPKAESEGGTMKSENGTIKTYAEIAREFADQLIQCDEEAGANIGSTMLDIIMNRYNRKREFLDAENLRLKALQEQGDPEYSNEYYESERKAEC